jgi:hypothetical protein
VSAESREASGNGISRSAKADVLSKASIRPLEKERRAVDDRLQGVQREILGLLNLAKQGGASRNAAEEVSRLEETKRTLEAHSVQLEARLAFRKRVVVRKDGIQDGRNPRFLESLLREEGLSLG